jgi:hypothetical protein
LCSLFPVPANGGGIILWISCYYLIHAILFAPFSSHLISSLNLLCVSS